MRRFAHIIAPVLRGVRHDLAIAQPITFESMRQARARAADVCDVDLLCAVPPDETADVPFGFRATEPLMRSVQDLRSFRIPRTLPLLKDVLEAAARASDADYLIYTNVDIALVPEFYRAVDAYIASGEDALVITRRSLAWRDATPADLPALAKEEGGPHQGFDCFIFRRDALSSYEIGSVCLGSSHVDLPLVCSLITYAKKFGLHRDDHLTFHLGDAQEWWSWKYRDYVIHNDCEAARTLLRLAKKTGVYRHLSLLCKLLLHGRVLHNRIFVRAWMRAVRRLRQYEEQRA